MAPVPYPCQLQLMPYTSPHLLCNVWRRLYPHGDDPVYRVYRERLADSVYEYHAVVTLRPLAPYWPWPSWLTSVEPHVVSLAEKSPLLGSQPEGGRSP